MISSKYITDILDLLLDGDEEGIAARPQMQYLTDEEYYYTGGGLFVQFSHPEEISQHKIRKGDLILNGVTITTTELTFEAEALLFFKNGIINYLEIWCYLGDYPHHELTKYMLKQSWIGSKERQLANQ